MIGPLVTKVTINGVSYEVNMSFLHVIVDEKDKIDLPSPLITVTDTNTTPTLPPPEVKEPVRKLNRRPQG